MRTPQATKSHFLYSWYSWRNGLFILLALLPWALILVTIQRGFDLTDESFYLLNYAHIEDVTAAFSLFGTAGRPLYDLSGGDIVTMRILGVVVWLAISVFTTWATVAFLSRRPMLNITTIPLPLLLPIAGAALYYKDWLLTPSYNWLTLVGLALFWAGFLFWLEPNRPLRYGRGGAGLLAFAAAMVFWSKPTSAALLLAFPLLALLLNRTRWRHLLALPTLVTGIGGLLLGLSLPLLYGLSPEHIITTLTRGVEHRQLFVTGDFSILAEAIGQLIGVLVGNVFVLLILPFWLLPLLFAVFILRAPQSLERHRQRMRFFIIVGMVSIILLATVLMAYNSGYWSINIILCISLFLSISHFIERPQMPVTAGPNWLISALWSLPFFALVFIFIFGTSNDYAMQMGLASYFLLMGLMVIFLAYPDANPMKRTVMGWAVPLILVGIVWITFMNSLAPYRQEASIWSMDQRVLLPGSTQMLIVSDETATYLRQLQAIADDADFQPGTPLIDLTGYSPGAVYMLSARAYGYPWLIGGFGTASDAGAIYILNQWQTEQINSSWILTVEANGESPLSPAVIASTGLDFPAGFEQVGTLHRPFSDEIQALWRPIDSAPLTTIPDTP